MSQDPLQQAFKLLGGQTRLAEDGREHPASQLAVQWHDHDAPVVVSQLLVAATHADDREAACCKACAVSFPETTGSAPLMPGYEPQPAPRSGAMPPPAAHPRSTARAP